MKELKFLTLGLAAATTLFLAGCTSETHDHAGHSHGEEAAGHSHEGEEGSGHDADTGHGDAHPEEGTIGEAAEAAMALIEEPTAEQIAAAKAYPLETCSVSDEKLGGMGEPVVLVYNGQQLKLCCSHCLPDVKKDPAKLLTKLAQ